MLLVGYWLPLTAFVTVCVYSATNLKSVAPPVLDRFDSFSYSTFSPEICTSKKKNPFVAPSGPFYICSKESISLKRVYFQYGFQRSKQRRSLPAPAAGLWARTARLPAAQRKFSANLQQAARLRDGMATWSLRLLHGRR
jgi:hypothetical protein